MKKPPGISKEQWGEYQRVIKLSLDVASRSLDAIAEANFQAGQITERYRIIKLLEDLHPDSAVTRILVAIIKGETSE